MIVFGYRFAEDAGVATHLSAASPLAAAARTRGRYPIANICAVFCSRSQLQLVALRAADLCAGVCFGTDELLDESSL